MTMVQRPKKADLLAHWLGFKPEATAAGKKLSEDQYKMVQRWLLTCAAEIKKETKCGSGSLGAALKHIATLFQNKLGADKEHEAQVCMESEPVKKPHDPQMRSTDTHLSTSRCRPSPSS